MLARLNSQLRERFRTNRPFPHLVIDDFLDPAWSRELQEQFPEWDPSRAANELGHVGGKAVYSQLAELGPAYSRFDEMIRSAAFLDAVGAATGIAGLQYDPSYIGGGVHLNANGQDLDTHVDFNYHPETKLHRRLNLLLFLNQEWDESWGGNLELMLDPSLPAAENEVVRVAPVANRCVIFETSERSWHGFERIRMPEDKAWLGRRSIAVYFYTKHRPAAETAPSHATFYIPRPLPDRFVAGHTLTPEDAHELQVLVSRRDTQIRYLYDRELEFGRLLASPTFRLARLLAAPARWLKRRSAS